MLIKLHTLLSLAFNKVAAMILNGFTSPAKSVSVSSRLFKTKPCSSTFARINHLPATVGFQSSSRSSSRSSWDLKSWSIGDVPFLHLSAASTPLLRGDLGGLSYALPSLPRRRGSKLVPRASKDVPYSYKYPPMTKKPRWWWRTLASIPYLMPLHETWMYAETAYHLHPFLEELEFLTYPFLGVIGSLPKWFLLAYFFVAYLGVVRRKEWPHFFRFHVVMGMLLEIALQVIGFVSRWMPLAIYWGKVGMHFWTFMAFAYLFTVLECIRCALAGMYADVPFVSDAAYIQIPYEI
ncbi:HIT-type Zinc finger family protein [Corchorus capsularis]|uniref:Protein TIC 20 n=1 Tax=Corchorus capsularis TaxID=210143 RepID=A0A1R3IY72_COCAP|nr:HIT-type Zinc finger family protein [Corchorus capsularis]